MGRDWLAEIRLDWQQVRFLMPRGNFSRALNQLLDEYSELFKKGSSPMNTFEASLHHKPNCKPSCQPKFVMVAINCELDTLEQVQRSHTVSLLVQY